MSDIFILDEEKKAKKSIAQSQKGNFMDKVNAYLLSKQSLTVRDKVIFYRLLSTMIMRSNEACLEFFAKTAKKVSGL